MAKRSKTGTIIILILLIPLLMNCVSLQKRNVYNYINIVTTILKEYHYNYPGFNNNFYDDVKGKFFPELDPLGIYFMEDDAAALCSMNISVDDDSGDLLTAFLDKSGLCYKERLMGALDIISDLENAPMDYTKKETMNFTEKQSGIYAKNKAELIERWKQKCKYEILSRLFKKTDTRSTIRDFKQLLTEKEAAIRSSVLAFEKKKIRDILYNSGEFKTFMRDVFLKAFVARCDPHSSYFSTREVNYLEESVNVKPNVYGMQFIKNARGDLSIDNIIPGSPAWKSSQLNYNDIVLGISYQSHNDLTDIMEFPPHEINNVLNNLESDHLTVTIKKPNGVINKVMLIREEYTEEAEINGFILKGEKKIGYIYLPAFYTDWITFGARGCSNDMAKCIMKLKKENIEGLILDLRNNSGGALIEAIELAGIFIDEGPLCVEVAKDRRPVILKDPARGSVYSGPLAIMVNGQSASASEIFVSAMKYHSRALIIGSTTYGKATSQILLPVTEDMTSIRQADDKPLDNYALVKLTMDMYYDLSGNSYQRRGLQPDVFLPELFTDMYEKEKDLDYTLLPETIQIEGMYNTSHEIPRRELSALSNARIMNNKSFTTINSLNSDIQSHTSHNRVYSLHIDDFFQTMKKERDCFESIGNKIKSSTAPFTVANTAVESELLTLDSRRRQVNELLIREIMGDPYIGESFYSICDYIHFITNQEEK